MFGRKARAKMTLMTIGATAERLERQDLSPNPIMVAEKCGQVLINALIVHVKYWEELVRFD